jgi:hypothetical protein
MVHPRWGTGCLRSRRIADSPADLSLELTVEVNSRWFNCSQSLPVLQSSWLRTTPLNIALICDAGPMTAEGMGYRMESKRHQTYNSARVSW